MRIITPARLSTIGRYFVGLCIVALSSLAGSLIDFLGLMLNLYAAGYREFGAPEFGLLFATVPLEGEAYILADGLAAGLVSVVLAADARNYRDRFLRAFISATAILVAFDLSSEPPLMVEYFVHLVSDVIVGLLIGLLAPFPASYLTRVLSPAPTADGPEALAGIGHLPRRGRLTVIEALIVLALAAIWIVAAESVAGRFASWAIVSLSAVAALVKIREYLSRGR